VPGAVLPGIALILPWQQAALVPPTARSAHHAAVGHDRVLQAPWRPMMSSDTNGRLQRTVGISFLRAQAPGGQRRAEGTPSARSWPQVIQSGRWYAPSCP